MNKSKVDILQLAANSLINQNLSDAIEIINEYYPFQAITTYRRSYTAKQMMAQFFKDGFIDRYSGEKLVNPGILRVLSEKMPDAFPYHPHWKTDECHIAYWNLQPTIDHIFPIALGGKDEPSNWATTSMINNSAKANFTLEELNWKLKNKGDIDNWDGLSKIFIEIVEKDSSLLKISGIETWYKVTKQFMKNYKP